MDRFVFVTLMSTWAVTIGGLAAAVVGPSGIAAQHGRIERVVRMPVPHATAPSAPMKLGI